ncbi:MAG TPA: VC_2705 family sodium/solute symporter [Bauldia sp.]|nr:VC_2705 family sodium/solute symporter [Bauldia sp.]
MAGINEEARRLGKVYGLLVGAFALLVTVVAMLAQFGLPDPVIAVLVVMITIVTYAVIGVVSRTLSLAGFYLADRFVPAGFNGMVTAAAIFAAPFLGLAGTFFADRFLGLAIVAGLAGGYALLGVLVAPYYRKSGAVTLPDFFAVRFGNPLVRIVAVVILVAVSLPILASATAIASQVASLSLRLSPEFAAIAVLVVVLLTSLLGGMRATTFSGGAQAAVAILAILVPAMLVSVQEYRFPVPQITFGYALEEAARLAETPIGMLAGKALPITGLDGFNMFALALCLAAGIASMPQLVSRFGAAQGPGQARLTAGWALVVIGIVASTAPAIAAFVRLALLRDLVGVDLADLPQWVFDYGRAGMLSICGKAAVSAAAIGTACGAGTVVNGLVPEDIAIGADLVTLGFAEITGLPYVLSALIAAGAIAAALATAATALTTIAISVGNDFFGRLFARRASAGRRLIVTRLVLIATAAIAAWLAFRRPDDVFAYAMAAPSVAAAGFFPALVLGVFWKRTTFWGALVGMVAGAGTTAVYAILLHTETLAPMPVAGLTDLGISAPASAVFGVPLGFALTVVVSLVTRAPSLGRLEVADAIRRPNPDPILEDHAV